MENLASPKIVKEIIKKYGFRFSKSLGQNFLIDGNIINKIVDLAQVTKDDYILEIGPGLGTLTQALCSRAKKVVAVEIDSKLIPILNENLGECTNFKLIHNDILKVDIQKLVKEEFDNNKFKVVANLPYYVTTPIIMDLLENQTNILNITIMIQKEVAQRLSAMPGTKDYGSLTLAVQYYCIPKIGFGVSKQCFLPQPNVDSIVIKLDILNVPPVEVKDKKMLFNIIRAAFAQRRKTLINSLTNSTYLSIDKTMAKELLSKAQISENQRGETLTLKQFADLANLIYK